MSKVYNKSKLLVEKAEKVTCPRCKGYGGCYRTDEKCWLCNGLGKLWKSKSGWTRALYQRLGNSQLW